VQAISLSDSDMETITDLRSISLLIPDGETWDAVKVLRCLGQSAGIRTHVLSRTRRPLARFSRFCTSCHWHSSQNDESWVNVISRLVRELQIDFVLPVTEKGVELLVRNHDAVSKFAAIAPLPGLESLKTAQDKWEFYEFCRTREFPVPPSILIRSGCGHPMDSIHLRSLKYPALLKPTLLGGGCGIVRVEKASDFQQVWEDKRVRKDHGYMLQSYVPGVDVCVQVFCKKGEILTYTVQKNLNAPEDFFGPQRVMEFVEDNEAVELGARLVSAMGFEGIACIDFRVDVRDGTYKIIEINPRFGQAILGSLVAGVNFPLIACLDVLGLAYHNEKYRTVRYAHPRAHVKTLISQLIGRQTPGKIRWRESGLRFTCSDPLPEMVDIIRRTGKCLQR